MSSREMRIPLGLFAQTEAAIKPAKSAAPRTAATAMAAAVIFLTFFMERPTPFLSVLYHEKFFEKSACNDREVVIYYLSFHFRGTHQSVSMAMRVHPFPSRTRQLSSSVPTILGGQPPGKIGRCRHKKEFDLRSSSFFVSAHLFPRSAAFIFYAPLFEKMGRILFARTKDTFVKDENFRLLTTAQ